ncbi:MULTISPECIES: MarR family winged helix-turn-helix transcriptional regulator [unclassified Isoptericola]|uniref:MarR family winged helix-turn-helix transcriptional regulator n=1 Tax=Isoptericola sp. NPDC057191 TaxID=3346041 RepID=UPI003639CB53
MTPPEPTTPSAPPSAPEPRGAADVRLAAEAWESLFRAQVTLMRRFQADPIWHDLTMREYDVLFTLSRAPGGELRLRDLNEGMLLAQSSLSRMVERLEARGLVVRSVPRDDARGTLVRLTADGARRQRETGLAHVRTIAEYVGQALPPEELEQLRDVLDRLRAAQSGIPDRPSSDPGDLR